MADREQDRPPGAGEQESAERWRSGRQAPAGDGTGVPDSDRPGDDAATERTGLQKALRYTLIVLGSVAGAVVVLLLMFVLVLQTNWGGTYFGDFLITLANPFGESETEYSELRGNFLTRIELRDLRIYRLDTVYVDTIQTTPREIRYIPEDSVRSPAELAAFDSMYVDSLMLAVIDTFRVRYDLLSLLRQRVRLRELYLANPVLRARQRADSTWDLMEPFGADTSAAETGKARFAFQIDSLNVTNAELLAIYNPPSTDSTFEVRNFNIRAGDLLFEERISGRLDTLYASYSPPGESGWTELRAGGRMIENELDVTGLEVESARSLVTASGTLRLPTGEESAVQDIAFELEADPIAFRDLYPFVPALNPDRSATLSVRVGGTSRLMNVDASGSFSDGSSLTLTGDVSPTREGPLTYRADGMVRAFNPAFFTGEGTSGLINADFEVDLSGASAEALDGTASARIFDSSLGGLGLDLARISAAFSDGQATLDLTSSLDGSTVVAGGAVRPFAEIPSYDLEGRTANFNVASLGLDDQQSDIDAAFEIEGYGFDPQTAEITADVRMGRSTINRYTIEDGRVQLELANAAASYGFRFLFPDGSFVANGEAQLEDPMHFAVERGRFENVDLAALLNQEGESSLNGTFRLEATGTDPQQMVVEAALDIQPSRYLRYSVTDGMLRVNLEAGRMALVARAALEEAGQFNFAATTRPFDEVPTLNITRGEFTNVNIGPLLDQPGQSSDLSGTARFTIRGFDPETMTLDGRFTLTGSRINEQIINSATAEIDLARGTLAFDADVDIPEGSARLAGSARPFLDLPTYQITDGRFRNIDLAAFTGNPNLESRLNGAIAVSGTGFDPEAMDLEGRIDFGESVLNEQRINEASISGRMEDGVLDADLTLSVPEGETFISGTVQPFLQTPTYQIREGTFAGINVAAFTGNPEWQTDLEGSVSLAGRGFDPETLTAEGTLRLSDAVVNDAVISDGRISGSLDDGFARIEAQVAFSDGSARVRGSGRFFADVPQYALDGTLAGVDVGGILGTDTLSAQISAAFDVEGAGTDPETMELRGLLSSSGATYQGTVIDSLFTRFDLSDGILSVDSLLLRSTAADAEGSGVIAVFDSTAASDFRFAAQFKDLAPLRDFVAAEKLQLEEGLVEGRVYGRPGMLRFDATGSLRSFIYDDIRLAEFEGTVAGEIGIDRQLNVAEVRGDFTSISLPQLLIENADLNVSYTPEGIQFSGNINIEQGRSGTVAGHVETAEDAGRIVLDEMTLQLDEDRWELLQQATISYGEEYRIRNLLLHSDGQQLAVDGVVDPDGEQNLVMTLENFRIGAVADLLGYEGLNGDVTGSLLLSGPAAAPNMTGTLNTEIASQNQDVGDLRLTLDYTDLRLTVDALLTHVDGSTLDVEGYLPLDLRVARLDEGGVEGGITDRSIEFTVAADSFDVDWIEPFLNPETIDAFDGRLSGDVNVSGSVESPVLDGSARFTGGRIGLPELGLTYSGIQANLVLARNEVAVNDLVIRSGDGSVRGDGTVNLSELTLGEFEIDLRADEFLAISSLEYRFVVNGDMQLSGTTERPVLEGGVRVIRGDINLTEESTSPELEQVQLTDEDLQTVERRFGVHVTEADTSTFSLYDALAMDLDVNIERDTWIRSRINPVMDIQFSGDLELVKEHYQDVQMYGTIDVVPQHSRIVQFGKRFDITNGTLAFNGPPTDPRIDVEAQYAVRSAFSGRGSDVSVTLTIEGRMSEQLDLTLGSDMPGLEPGDVLSLIATGQLAGEGLQLGGGVGTVIGTGRDLALGQLTTLFEGIAGAGLGLDIVSIEYNSSLGGTTLTAGKYVSSRLFVAVSQPIDSEGNTPTGAGSGTMSGSTPLITVEYELRNWLLLRLIQHDSVIRLNLLWEHSY